MRAWLGNRTIAATCLRQSLAYSFTVPTRRSIKTQMYAPVGGMDQIAQGFVRKVGRFIRTGAEVKEIRHGNPGVRVVYEMNGDTLEETADYCICTLPPPIMRRLRTDLTPQLRNVINVVPFQNSGKIGIQFKRRFWEEDDRIFGGVSWTTLPNAEVWYPHYDFFCQERGCHGLLRFSVRRATVSGV